MSIRQHLLSFTEREQAKLLSFSMEEQLAPNDILAKTLYSWVSAGTETVGLYAGEHFNIHYPAYPGYSSVSRVIATGEEVKDIQPGDLVLGGNHALYQKRDASLFNKIDEGVDPKDAAFIHMFKIPLPAFIRTQIHGPEKCVVTGLGLVGLCAAQLARMFGFDVYGFDLNEKRRAIAERHGIKTVTGITEDIFGKTVGLGVDCTGHEGAVLSLSKVIRRFGEIALVGVPWKRNADICAQELLHSIFYNYLTVRTGWEGDMPDHQDIFSNANFECETMRAIKNGFLKINEADYDLVPPEDPQVLYQNILHNNVQSLGYMLDWTHFE